MPQIILPIRRSFGLPVRVRTQTGGKNPDRVFLRVFLKTKTTLYSKTLLLTWLDRLIAA